MNLCAIVEAGDPLWQEMLRFLPQHDFHHLAGYVALEAGRRGGQACAFVYRDGEAAFLVPFVQSAVPLTLQPRRIQQADALSPYGYAGPLVNAPGGEEQRSAFVATALARMVELLRERGVCTLFIRFHPLLVPPLGPFQALGTLVLHGETVWVDLRRTPESLWADTRSRFRTYIRQLERDGYKIEMDPTAVCLQQFVTLYHSTMRRVGASPEYFFSAQYFQRMQEALREKFHLAHVRSPAGTIVSSVLFTVCSGIVQYHLSGNNVENEGSNALKLLLHGIQVWAQQQGLDKFHLGGGLGAVQDALFQFKSGFSSLRAPFYSWRMIVDEKVCGILCRQWEKLNREEADSPEGFFPPYRKPSAVYRNLSHRSE